MSLYRSRVPVKPPPTPKSAKKAQARIEHTEPLHFRSLSTTTPTPSKMDAQKMNRGTEAMKAHFTPTSEMEGTGDYEE
jgi:hypothetical protein